MKDKKKLLLVTLIFTLIFTTLMFAQKDSIQAIKTKSKLLYATLNENEKNPIYVLNGIICKDNELILNAINPNEIKNMEVLNDQDAINKYGIIAKNGAILITFKNKSDKLVKKLCYKKTVISNNGKNEVVVSGIIYDSNNLPMPAVVISNLNAKEAFYSDFDGKYTITAHENDALVYSFDGFESKRMLVGKETKIDINLKEEVNNTKQNVIMVKKPIIYLYPTHKTDITVTLDFKGELLSTFPKYEANWDVTAYPDGRIFDKKTNRFYNSLFWDGNKNFPNEHYQYKTGFAVVKNNLTDFLIEKLEFMGLNNIETNEFIQFWLPLLEKNEMNFIHFYVNSDYDTISKNNVIPKPDTSIRIFMEFYSLDKAINIPEQVLPKTERKGFTLVEWGGCDVTLPLNQIKHLKF